MKEFLVIFKNGDKIIHRANCIEDIYIYYLYDTNEYDDKIKIDPGIEDIIEYTSDIIVDTLHSTIRKGINL